MKKCVLAPHTLALVAGSLLFLSSCGGGDGAASASLYFYNPENDRDASGNVLCSEQGLVAVERDVSLEDENIEEVIRLLLAGGLSTDERAQGITTEFPLSDVSLTSAQLEGGMLTLTFADPENRTSGGACRVGVLRAQVEATAKQFPGVATVRFEPEELFQP